MQKMASYVYHTLWLKDEAAYLSLIQIVFGDKVHLYMAEIVANKWKATRPSLCDMDICMC